jgi:hypothetical protein
MSTPSTALDVLIAELLGDVGNLHAEVKALSDTLPAMTAAVTSATVNAEKRLDRVISKLENQASVKSSGRITLSRFSFLGALTVAGVCGAIGVVATIRTVSPQGLLSINGIQTYQSGQFLEKAWPNLDEATKRAIKKAAAD